MMNEEAEDYQKTPVAEFFSPIAEVHGEEAVNAAIAVHLRLEASGRLTVETTKTGEPALCYTLKEPLSVGKNLLEVMRFQYPTGKAKIMSGVGKEGAGIRETLNLASACAGVPVAFLDNLKGADLSAIQHIMIPFLYF